MLTVDPMIILMIFLKVKSYAISVKQNINTSSVQQHFCMALLFKSMNSNMFATTKMHKT